MLFGGCLPCVCSQSNVSVLWLFAVCSKFMGVVLWLFAICIRNPLSYCGCLPFGELAEVLF